MKSLLITITAFILSINAFAQNWQTFNSKVECNFNDNFVVFDSVKVRGADTILYNFKTIRQVRSGNPTNHSFSAIAPTWVGKTVVIKPNGVNVFLNGDNDSIYIHTLAKSGEIFTIYDNVSKNLNIIGRVDSVVTGKILGVTDSLKYITLLTNGNVGYGSTNDKITSIVLSKNFGLLQTVAFLNIGYTYNLAFEGYKNQLTLNGNTLIPNTYLNLKVRDIYDFNPGDELHIVVSQNDGPNIITHTVKRIEKYLTRTLSSNQDTIIYTIEVKEVKQVSKSLEVVKTLFTTQTVKYFLNSTSDPLNRISGKVYLDNSLNYLRISVSQKGNTKIPYGAHFPVSCITPDSCTQVVDGIILSSKYIKGLGGDYYTSPMSVENFGAYNRELVYWKKGSSENGIALNLDIFLSDDDKQLEKNKPKIYPNPVKNILTIESPVGSSVSIRNMIGKEVFHTDLNASKNEINISRLNAGVYFLTIMSENKTITEKVIVE